MFRFASFRLKSQPEHNRTPPGSCKNQGEGIDHRSDLFSLGSVMYAMATGHPPFRAETPYGILRRITDHDHRPVQEIRSDVPPWLCSIIDRLLRKNAADRFASAEKVAALLEDCLAHVQQPSQVPLPEALQLPGSVETVRRRRLFWAIALASVAIEATAAILRPTLNSTKTSAPAMANDFQTEPTSREPSAFPDASITESDLLWNDSAEINNLESTLKDLQNEIAIP